MPVGTAEMAKMIALRKSRPPNYFSACLSGAVPNGG